MAIRQSYIALLIAQTTQSGYKFPMCICICECQGIGSIACYFLMNIKENSVVYKDI